MESRPIDNFESFPFARPVRSLVQSGYAMVPISSWFVAPMGAHLAVTSLRRFSSLLLSSLTSVCMRLLITAYTFLGSCPVPLFSRRRRETEALRVRCLLLSVADAEMVGRRR